MLLLDYFTDKRPSILQFQTGVKMLMKLTIQITVPKAPGWCYFLLLRSLFRQRQGTSHLSIQNQGLNHDHFLLAAGARPVMMIIDEP